MMDIKTEPPCDIFDEEEDNEMFDICDEADNEIFDVSEVVGEVLPEKSLARYKSTYDVFTKWQKSKGTNSFDEPLLLNYFYNLSANYKPSSMWSTYSMLKSTIMCNHNIDISQHSRLMAFLKKKSAEYKPPKAKVFTTQELNKFLLEASDQRYLAMKTVAVFSAIGACRGDEATYVMIDHIKDYGDEIITKIPDKKTKIPKTYSINGQYAEIVRKYMRLRPVQSSTNRFFLQYLNGKCTSQVIGKHTIARMPKEIAKFLELPEHEAYTGYSFRRKRRIGDSSSGIEMMNHREPSTVERCIAESIGNKVIIRNLNDKEINLPSTSNVIIKSEPYENQSTPSTATSNTASQHYENGKRYELRLCQESEHTENTESKSTIFQFFNCNNITFNISK